MLVIGGDGWVQKDNVGWAFSWRLSRSPGDEGDTLGCMLLLRPHQDFKALQAASTLLHRPCLSIAQLTTLSHTPSLSTPQDFRAYAKLRVERSNARLVGVRAKRAKEAEAAEKENS